MCDPGDLAGAQHAPTLADVWENKNRNSAPAAPVAKNTSTDDKVKPRTKKKQRVTKAALSESKEWLFLLEDEDGTPVRATWGHDDKHPYEYEFEALDIDTYLGTVRKYVCTEVHDRCTS